MADKPDTASQRETTRQVREWEAHCANLVEGQQRVLTRYLEGFRTLSDEISEIAKARLRLSTEAWSALAACRNPEEVIDCQTRLVAQFTEHSVKEVAKLSELAMTLVRRANTHERTG